MAEARLRLLEFFIAQLGPGSSLERYRRQGERGDRGEWDEKGEWVSVKIVDEFSKALSKKGSRILLKRAGQDFAALVREDVAQSEHTGIEGAVSLLPKVFAHYFRGEGSGIVKTEFVGPGLVCVRENSPFDCLFTEGLFVGFLQSLGARGVIVRQTICRRENNNEKFCVYELKWMKTFIGK